MSAIAWIGRSLEWFKKIIFLRSRSPARDPRRLGLAYLADARSVVKELIYVN